MLVEVHVAECYFIQAGVFNSYDNHIDSSNYQIQIDITNQKISTQTISHVLIQYINSKMFEGTL